MSNLSFSDVGEILHLLQEVDCAEIDLEWGELRIQVRKAGTTPHVTTAHETSVPPTALGGGPSVSTQDPPTPEVSQEAEAAGPEVSQEAAAASVEIPANWSGVSAPMAGTFYRSPSPGDPPFAEVGSLVEAGDTVGLIEVMKLFAELKAEVAGKVARIDAQDGDLVEFGQPLVWIEPA